MNCGKRIKEYRQLKGITQKGLGERCTPHMDSAAIRRYESGRANPKPETLQKISKALADTQEEYAMILSDLLRDTVPESALHIQPSQGSGESLFVKNMIKAIEEKDLYLEELKTHFNELNDTGKKKAIDQVEMLSKIPEYRAGATDPGEEQ